MDTTQAKRSLLGGFHYIACYNMFKFKFKMHIGLGTNDARGVRIARSTYGLQCWLQAWHSFSLTSISSILVSIEECAFNVCQGRKVMVFFLGGGACMSDPYVICTHGHRRRC